ncbi:hypothetical protein [Butyrivibrio sp. MB2005]|uniref:hypothetical protein n=1 Tax=Butyrivibrio sp. MB2005 TaxID=1280678 RepID=UPI0003FC3274|nr:hypothetical protein [Butyrivibrio sp. MB2005]
MINIINCKNCGNSYGYEIWGPVFPGGKELEEAICPYCQTVGFKKMTSQNISSFKIDSNGNKIDD